MISEPELEGAGDDPPDGPSRAMPSVPAPRTGADAPPPASGPGASFGPGAPAGPDASAGFDASGGFGAPAGSGPADAPGVTGGPGTTGESETIAGRRPSRLLQLPRPSWLPSRRAPWLWALGGALVASAVWAAGLYAYGGTEPDLGGYQVSRDLCQDAELPAMSALLGKRQFPRAAVDEQLAIDRAFCSLTLMAGRRNEVKNDSRPVAYAGVDINYSLHKRTDPGPEFDATVTRLAPDGALERRVMRIPDLGERAYMVTDPSGDSPELTVLDGQAVLTIAVSQTVNYTANPATGDLKAPDAIDFSGVQPAMVEDMRDLMDALKR
ncbi:hypothetical protein [Streptomyces sp. NPDC056672]|uniref:hypothetical protein n=1 Tax=Streptomyces sp. NPDC056672 TaxID=3345906 RepID=UPI00367593E3